MRKLKITQIRSAIGRKRDHRETLRALGLRYQKTVIHPDTPQVRGMVAKVRYLVSLEEVEEARRSVEGAVAQ